MIAHYSNCFLTQSFCQCLCTVRTDAEAHSTYLQWLTRALPFQLILTGKHLTAFGLDIRFGKHTLLHGIQHLSHDVFRIIPHLYHVAPAKQCFYCILRSK